MNTTDPGGSAVQGVGLKPLDCRECEFEPRSGHGCSSLLLVVFCASSGLCDGLITRSDES